MPKNVLGGSRSRFGERSTPCCGVPFIFGFGKPTELEDELRPSYVCPDGDLIVYNDVIFAESSFRGFVLSDFFVIMEIMP